MPSLGLTALPPATLERDYLDTFDWRLFDNGVVLVDETPTESGREGSRRALVLQDRAGVRSDLRVPAPAGPRTVPELPSSLRHRVGTVVGSRMLVEVGHERVEVWPLRLLDDEGKTVAGIDVERVEHDGSPAVVRVQLHAIRGYQREARRLRALLDSQADLRPADDPMVAAVRRTGTEPGVAPGPAPLRLDASMPGHIALATMFAHLLDALVAYEDGAKRRVDPEFLHHFRITVRKTRSAIRLAKKRLPSEMTDVWEPEWRWLARVTCAPRDLDVLLQEIATARATAEGDAKLGLDELAERVERKRAKAQRKLEAALAGDRYGTLKRGWRVAIDELRATPTAPAGDDSAESVAHDVVRRATTQLVEHAAAITPDSPSTAIHDLRKRTKRLRYAVELFQQLLPPHTARGVIKRTKRMQDDLGEFQDSDVHHHIVSGLVQADGGLSPDAVEAANALLDTFEERHAKARERLGREIDRFSTSMATAAP